MEKIIPSAEGRPASWWIRTACPLARTVFSACSLDVVFHNGCWASVTASILVPTLPTGTEADTWTGSMPASGVYVYARTRIWACDLRVGGGGKVTKRERAASSDDRRCLRASLLHRCWSCPQRYSRS